MLSTRRRVRISSALILAVAFGAGVLAPLSPGAAAPRQVGYPPSQTAPQEPSNIELEHEASQAAAATNKPVVVDELTTPTEKVVASPDGSFAKTVSTEPVRMLVNNVWTDISTDLVDSGGVLKPKAAPADLQLGKGGTPHLSTVADGEGHAVSESWPYGNVPKPTVKGNVATYAGILPGVDLIQIVKKQGISQVLKIYTPEAGRDPRVTDLKLKLETKNIVLGSDGDGGLTGTSVHDGEEVLTSAAGQWWDSRHAGAGPTDPGGPGITGSFDLSLVTDSTGTHEKLGIASIAARTDLTYPLYIDPDWSTQRASFVYVDSGFPTTSYWNGQYTTGNVNLGFLPAKWDYSYGINHSARGYWQFNTSPLVGKKIIAAKFNVTNIWSSSCAARTVRARVTGGIGPGTTWNSQPGWVRDLDAKAFAYGYSGCPTATVGFDMMAAATIFPTVGQWTVGLFADGEASDELSWKRFANDASITITYGTSPNPPQLTSMSGCSHQCPDSGAQPGLTRFTNPVFSVYASDPDGNGDGNINVYMSLFKNGQVIWTTNTPLSVPGTGGTVNWGPGTGRPLLTDGDYVFQTQVADQTGMTSPTTAYTFKVDTTAPPAPSISTSSPALASGLDSNGVVGQTAYDFQLTNPSVDPVKGFIYALTGDGITPSNPGNMSCGQSISYFTMVCPADGKTTSFQVAAITKNNTKITAWSIDEAGNVGTIVRTLTPSTKSFNVGKLSPLPSQNLTVALTGLATALSIPAGTQGPAGTCSEVADPEAPPGFSAPALGLQGGYGSTSSSAANTAGSFTVSGWFCPTAVTASAVQPVITQTDATNTSLAELRINAASKWELTTRTAAGGAEAAATGTTVTSNNWYFVNAVYDKVNRQLRITTHSGNDVSTWTVATSPTAHAAVPAGAKVLLGASSTAAGTPRFQGLLARPTLTNGVLVKDQITQLWSTEPTTVTVLK